MGRLESPQLIERKTQVDTGAQEMWGFLGLGTSVVFLPIYAPMTETLRNVGFPS